MDRFFTRISSAISAAAGQPLAFLTALGVIAVWAVTGPIFDYSNTWQLIINTGTTIITFLMVFLIQNSQNRDGGAIQAKLDELLRAVGDARNQFIGIEHLSDRQIELIRSALEKQAKSDTTRGKGKATKAQRKSAEDTVDRLLERF